MSQVKSVNTKPELIVRKYLHSRGLRFRLHDTRLPGKPDLALLNTKQLFSSMDVFGMVTIVASMLNCQRQEQNGGQRQSLKTF